MIILPITTGVACTLSLGNKTLLRLIVNKYNRYKKQKEKDQHTIKSFDTLCRKSLQDNIFDKSESESLCNIFTEYNYETKKLIFFINMNI